MKILVISSSSRETSESERISNYIANTLKDIGCDAEVYPLKNNPVPLWTEHHDGEEWNWCGKKLDEADGFVFVVPEWNGTAPPGLKNIFICAEYELAHKPCLLVGITVGLSGAYPLVELRMGSYKNTRICYLPEQVVIKQCHKFLQEDEPADDVDKIIRSRILYCLKLLREYTIALKEVRNSGIVDHETFPSGM